MKLKSELYRKEQHDIMNKLISILQLDPFNSITLYDLDNDINKQNQIMNLIPELRKYFTFNCIEGVKDPTTIKRPYLSIIKHIIKLEYKLSKKCCQITIANNQKIFTTKYIFTKNI